MMNKIHKMKSFHLVFILILLPVMSQAIPLKLTHEPLFLNQSVPPALAITFDDSGSMSWGFMPDSNTWSVNPSMSSPDYNLMMYNPTIVYKPPLRSDGSSYPDSDFNNAKFDGFYELGNMRPRVDLSVNYLFMWVGNSNYATGTATTTYYNAGRPGVGQAYYHSWNGPGIPVHNAAVGAGINQYTLNFILPADETNFANWYTYYNTRGKLAKAAVSHAFVNFGPNFKIDWQQLNNNRFPMTGGTNMKLFTGTHRQDFFDWLFTIPTSGGTPLRNSFLRAGTLFTKNGTDGPYYDTDFGGELACQQNFHIAISDGTWNGNEGVDTNPDNNDPAVAIPAIGAATPYIYSTSALPSSMYVGTDSETLADNGFEFWHKDLRTDLPNNVPQYLEDSTDRFGDIVPVSPTEKWWEKAELFWNPSNDPANWQHMVNFNIGLGLVGSLDRATALDSLRDGTLTWPSSASALGKVDDVWHSSVNSRGKYFTARDPLELAAALDDLVSNILKRKGRASSGSVSSSILTDETLAFKTGYDSSNWSGEITGSKINNDGSIGVVVWDAACKLTGGICTSLSGNPTVTATNTYTSRNIFSYDSIANTQQSFNAVNLSTAQQTELLSTNYYAQRLANGNPFTASEVVNYIRGDVSSEQRNGGDFRNRDSLLGDVIHSSAKIIRGPSSTFIDSNHAWLIGTDEDVAVGVNNGYEDFKNTYKDRDSILLTGANDGMLHAFDAGINTSDGGHELWAYIPSKAFKNLSELANPIYEHTSFVDTTPIVKDAFFNNTWRSVALGGMRHGGKMFYALDLGSDPKNVPNVLWEFSDEDDSDMGFTYPAGVIIRVSEPSSGYAARWVAILPNGYNSISQKSVMYAVDLETGVLLHKWDTNLGSLASPNGMGPPVASDYMRRTNPTDQNLRNKNTSFVDNLSEYVYAGDLYGNMYRFDMADIFSGSTVSEPELFYSGDISRPITTAPRIFNAEGENIIVVAGTGKYIELKDRSIVGIGDQYLFGLLDSDVPISNPYTLADTRIVEQYISNPTPDKRELTQNLVNANQSWKVKLPVQGERLVSGIGAISGGIFTTTIIPNGGDPCLAGGNSWLMFIDPRTGSTPESIGKILANGTADGLFIDDLVTGTNILTPAGGNTTIITIDGIGGGSTGGGIDPIDLEIGEKWRRRSWHRILID